MYSYANIATRTILFAALAVSVHAQTSWNSAVDGNWTNAANWSAGVPDAEAATIDTTGATYTVTYDGSSVPGFTTFTSLTVGATSGATTSIASVGATGFSFSGALTVNQKGRVDVVNGGVLTQTAGGPMILRSGGQFNVGTGGTAAIRGTSSTDSENAGAITVASGGSLANTFANFNLKANASLVNAGTFTSNKVVQLQGGPALLATVTNTGTMTLSGGATDSTLSVGSDNHGTFTMTAGTLSSTISGVTVFNRGISVSSGAGNVSGTFNLSGGDVTNNGILQVGVNTNTSAAARTSTGIFNISGGTWSNSTGRRIIFAGLTSTAATSTDYNVVGTANISGASVFTTDGPVYFGSGGTNGAGVNPGAVGTLNLSGGAFNVTNGSNDATVYFGVAATTLANAPGVITTIGQGNLNLTGGTLTADRLVANNGATRSNINFDSGTLSIKSSDVNTGSVVEVGDGVGAATLNLTLGGGIHNFAQGVQINENATLKGIGQLNGSVNLVGGTIAPGTSGSPLVINGTVSLNSDSVFAFSIGGTVSSYDSVRSGLITLSPGATLSLADPNGVTFSNGDVFDLFEGVLGGDPSFSGTFSNLILPTLGGGMSWDDSNLYGLGQLQVVPEPCSLGLLLFGAVVGTLHRRRQGMAL